MLTTQNYNLKKPDGGDPVDIRDLNDNADIIDEELKKRPTSTGDASEMIVRFEDARQLTELTSNDTLKNLFGKLKLVVRNVIKHGKQLGDTDIAGIGDGTVTGAIHAQNTTVNQCLKSVSDGKSAVASAITAQGVTTAADDTFDTMAANVTAAGNARYNAGVAATKVGTAVAANVLSGKTFTNASTVGMTGTMEDFTNSPTTITLEPFVTKSHLLSGLGVIRKPQDVVTYDITPGYYTKIKIDRSKVYLVDPDS